MVADANGNVNFVQTNSGLFNVAGLGYNTVNIDQMSTFVDMRPFLSSASISAQDNWLYTKQADCAVAGAKAFVGGFIMKKEIDSGVDFLAGQSLDETVPGMVTGGTMAKGAEVGLDHAAESRPLTTAVRAALREEGHKVSANAVGRGFKFFSRAALAVHVGLAMNEGREEYNACMAD